MADDWQPVAADDWQPVVNPSAQSPAAQPLGIAKQIGSGLIENAANVPGTVPQLLKQAGAAVSSATGLPQAPPIINAPPTPTDQLSAALPQPENPIEAGARTMGQFMMTPFTGKGHAFENIVGGIGAGTGAYLGPKIAPSLGLTPDQGAIAGALTGGFAGSRATGNMANAVTRNAMPKPQEILADTSNGYSDLRYANRSVIITPDQMRTFKNGMLKGFQIGGPAEADAPRVYSILNGLDADNGGTMADILNARKNLHAVLHTGHGAEIPAAILALDGFDRVINLGANPGTMAELQRLDANWGAARTAQAVDTKISQAEDRAEGVNSGMNSGNNIIQNINAFIKKRTDPVSGTVHINPQDLDALNNARKLDFGEKATRILSGSFGGGGGRDITAAAGLGAIGAFGANQSGLNATESSDPLIAGAAVPMLGLLLRHNFNRAVLRGAKNAEASILARAPYMQGVSVPRGLLSTPQVAGRSLLFAGPALRNSLAPEEAQ